MMSKAQWITCLTVALIVHIVLAAMFYESLANEGALDVGEAGIEVSIGLAGSYVEPEPEAQATPETSPETEPEPEPEPVPEPAPEPEPEPLPEPVPEPEPEIVPQPQPEPLPVPEPEPEPEPQPEPVKEQVEREPVPEPQPVITEQVEPVQLAEPVREVAPMIMRTASSEPAPFIASFVPPKSEPLTQPVERPLKTPLATGAANQQATGGDPAVQQSYFSQLAAWLEKYKEYPLRAKRRRMTGIVRVQFSINKNGELLVSEIVDRSSHQLLDETALKMLSKASPYPAIPASMGLDEITITLPVEFTLER